MSTVKLKSGAFELRASLFGKLPARRALILCHGANWDAGGWSEIAPLIQESGVPCLALNFRGYGGSRGSTSRDSAVKDVLAADAWLAEMGARQVGFCGASMGGSAVLRASAQSAPECVVAISAPVREMSPQEVRGIKGRKLFICADHDSLGAADAVKKAFAEANEPKEMRFFPGREHSIGMFRASYGRQALDSIIRFASHGL